VISTRISVALLKTTKEQLEDLRHKTQTYDQLIEEMIEKAGPYVGVNARGKKSNPAPRLQSQGQDAFPKASVVEAGGGHQ
jgi:hypothetical protein